MAETQKHPNYVGIWIALVVLFVLSVGAGFLGETRIAITGIFALAIIKAFLVISYYMHLRFEARWMRILMLSVLVLVGILFVGLVPDILYVYGD